MLTLQMSTLQMLTLQMSTLHLWTGDNVDVKNVNKSFFDKNIGRHVCFRYLAFVAHFQGAGSLLRKTLFRMTIFRKTILRRTIFRKLLYLEGLYLEKYSF